MNSVLIRGMEMPTTCRECIIGNPKAKTCIIGKPKMNTKRRDDCPLVEIPTPHGRLIDADALANTLRDVSKRQKYDKLFSDNVLSVGDVFDAIIADLEGTGINGYKLIPTVIEAEGSEE